MITNSGIKIAFYQVTATKRRCKPLGNAEILEFSLMAKRSSPETTPGEDVRSRALQLAFGEAVREARTKGKMSQAELAVRSRIAQQDISKIERGEINLTIRTMSRLADVLDNDVTIILATVQDSLKPK